MTNEKKKLEDMYYNINEIFYLKFLKNNNEFFLYTHLNNYIDTLLKLSNQFFFKYYHSFLFFWSYRISDNQYYKYLLNYDLKSLDNN